MNCNLNFIHVCDYASLSEGGKLNVLGIFETVFSKSIPFIHPQLYIVTNVNILKNGNYKQTIKIVKNKDKKEVIRALEFNLSVGQLPPDGKARVGVMGQLNNVKFEEFGDYTVQVFIDDDKIGETQLKTIQR